jgi:hypothetical protein
LCGSLRNPVPQNPSYYDLEDTSPEGVSEFLSSLVEGVLRQLEDDGCVEVRRGCSCRQQRGGGARSLDLVVKTPRPRAAAAFA